jgi:hypothetical protein
MSWRLIVQDLRDQPDGITLDGFPANYIAMLGWEEDGVLTITTIETYQTLDIGKIESWANNEIETQPWIRRS